MSTVSAIIAARDEQDNIETAVLSLAAQPEIAEIIVVNDQSSDATGTILSGLAARLPRLKVLETDKVPQGWTGKANALWQGVAVAQGEWLLFTDADVTHLPGSTARALEDAARSGAALVSYSPEQEMETWWERAIIPFVFGRLARLYPFDQVSDPASRVAAANGQYILLRRSVYDVIGGHAAVRSDVLEDVALARRAKAAGHRLYFAPGKGMARTRMYTSFRALWEGWTKNLYALVGRRPSAVMRELLATTPWLALLLFVLAGMDPLFAAVGAVVLVVDHVVYAAELRRIGAPLLGILYYVPAVFLYAALLIVSARRYAAGAVAWKGREYLVGSR